MEKPGQIGDEESVSSRPRPPPTRRQAARRLALARKQLAAPPPNSVSKAAHRQRANMAPRRVEYERALGMLGGKTTLVPSASINAAMNAGSGARTSNDGMRCLACFRTRKHCKHQPMGVAMLKNQQRSPRLPPLKWFRKHHCKAVICIGAANCQKIGVPPGKGREKPPRARPPARRISRCRAIGARSVNASILR